MASDSLDPGLVGRLEELLLHGRAELTRDAVEARSALPPDVSRRMWRALGFAAVEPGTAAFSPADIEALDTAAALAVVAGVTAEEGITIARTVGSVMSRLAEATAAALVSGLARARDTDRRSGVERDDIDRLRDVLPVIERLDLFVFRRHLLAALLRTMGEGGDRSRPLAVGFADLVGYTALSRHLDDVGLLRMVERLEEVGLDVITQFGGRLVKTVGDGILYVASDPAAAAEIALRLTEAGGMGDLPPIHAGVAYGPVLVHQGDVLGPVANLASRLTDLSRPSTVLVDTGLAASLAAAGARGFRTVALRAQRVRGYDHLAAHVLRRSG